MQDHEIRAKLNATIDHVDELATAARANKRIKASNELEACVNSLVSAYNTLLKEMGYEETAAS